jgi:hypothetical protein
MTSERKPESCEGCDRGSGNFRRRQKLRYHRERRQWLCWPCTYPDRKPIGSVARMGVARARMQP